MNKVLLGRISGLVVLAMALFLLAYSAGLGLPFLASALVMDRLTGVFGFARRHFLAMTITSATTTAIFGTLLALNRMSLVTTAAQHALSAIGLSGLLRLG